jgi:hypothetical protein
MASKMEQPKVLKIAMQIFQILMGGMNKKPNVLDSEECPYT